MKIKRILVSGGAGFIGSNLCEHLLKKKYHVTCLDNFSTGYRHNVELLFANPNFTLLEGDIRDFSTCLEAMKNVDAVLHEAALGSVPRSIKDPITTSSVNIGGTLNMLVAAKNAKVKRFIYAASSSTYGDSKALPKVENEIGKPLSPYAITKYVNELFAENFSNLYGLETIGLRYFNVFGRRQDPKSEYAAVIPKFVENLINHEQPIINGNGNYSRDFTYIDNVIQANMLALNSENPNAINQIYNVAFGEATTLKELFNYIKENLVKFDFEISKIEPIYGQIRIGDIPHSLACITKAKKLLGYCPQFDVKEGIKDVTKWYFENLSKL